MWFTMQNSQKGHLQAKRCMHRCQTKRCVAECCVLKRRNRQQHHQSVHARNKKQLHSGNDLTKKNARSRHGLPKGDATEAFVDAFNLHGVPVWVMPKIKHPSTMHENLQLQIVAPNVNSSHPSWSQGLQESCNRFACLRALMDFWQDVFSFSLTPKIQKSKNPKIQKRKTFRRCP